MGLDERFVYLIIGVAIGFLAGYITRSLREIKEELGEVEDTVKKRLKEDRDERGFVRYPYVADIALILVIIMTAWAAFASQKASNDVEQITVCNQKYLSETIDALNERTTYTQQQAQANVDLQEAQAEFLAVLLNTPETPENAGKGEAALRKYFTALTDFVTLNAKSAEKAETYPYPTNTDFLDCVEGRD